MCTLKRKVACIMLFDSVGKKCESFYIMALGTIRRYTVFYKLFFMIISMTVGTTVMFQRISKLCLMACLAIHDSDVFPQA